MSAHDLKRIREALDAADLVLVGASNGLDMAEGLNIFAPDAHFMQTYGDLAAVGAAGSILQGLHCSRGNIANYWAWQARFARCEHLDYEPGAVMGPLRELVGDTDYFVLTCNVDARFIRAGFDASRVLETEGSVAELACVARCTDERYPAGEIARELDASTRGGCVDMSLVPKCPHCGAALTCAIDERRMQHPDSALLKQYHAFGQLVDRHRSDNIVVLELGVGLRNGVIKHVLSDAVSDSPNLTYAIFNYNQVVFPDGLEPYCIGVDGDMTRAFAELR